MTTKMMTLVIVAMLGACGAADRSPTTTAQPARTAAVRTTADQWISSGCSDAPVHQRPVIRVEAPASCTAGSVP